MQHRTTKIHEKLRHLFSVSSFSVFFVNSYLSHSKRVSQKLYLVSFADAGLLHELLELGEREGGEGQGHLVKQLPGVEARPGHPLAPLVAAQPKNIKSKVREDTHKKKRGEGGNPPDH